MSCPYCGVFLREEFIDAPAFTCLSCGREIDNSKPVGIVKAVSSKGWLIFLIVLSTLLDLAVLVYLGCLLAGVLHVLLPMLWPGGYDLPLFILLCLAFDMSSYSYFSLPVCPVCQRRVSLRAVLHPGAEIHCPSCSNHFSLS